MQLQYRLFNSNRPAPSLPNCIKEIQEAAKTFTIVSKCLVFQLQKRHLGVFQTLELVGRTLTFEIG